MNLLVIGGGGREHALAWKLAQSPRVARVFVAPGNAGTAREPGLTNVAVTGVAELVAFAQRERVQLTVVGPEAPLAAGVVDAFRAAGLRIFGPTRAAAQLESSKDYAKAFMARHRHSDRRVPDIHRRRRGARLRGCARRADRRQGRRPRRRQGRRRRQRRSPRRRRRSTPCWSAMHWAAAGARVVVEDFLAGEEASFIVMVDGRNVLPLASSQDHKRLRDGDEGPNTGGMGAYSPAPVVTPEVHARIMREVILPDGGRHGGRRHPVHGLPLRRRDDRRNRRPARCWSSTAGWATPRRSRSWSG